MGAWGGGDTTQCGGMQGNGCREACSPVALAGKEHCRKLFIQPGAGRCSFAIVFLSVADAVLLYLSSSRCNCWWAHVRTPLAELADLFARHPIARVCSHPSLASETFPQSHHDAFSQIIFQPTSPCPRRFWGLHVGAEGWGTALPDHSGSHHGIPCLTG